MYTRITYVIRAIENNQRMIVFSFLSILLKCSLKYLLNIKPTKNNDFCFSFQKIVVHELNWTRSGPDATRKLALFENLQKWSTFSRIYFHYIFYYWIVVSNINKMSTDVIKKNHQWADSFPILNSIHSYFPISST